MCQPARATHAAVSSLLLWISGFCNAQSGADGNSLTQTEARTETERPATSLPLALAWPLKPTWLRFTHAFYVGLQHLNEDLPYHFHAPPPCDTKHSVLRAYACAAELREHKPVGIVGASWSSVTLQMVPISTQDRVLQCSPLSTTPDLSDTKKWPYFFRTIAPDDARAEAILSTMDHFGWKRAAVVHSTDKFSAGLTEKVAQGLQRRSGIDVSYFAAEAQFSSYLSSSALEQLEREITYGIRRTQVRVVLVFFLVNDIEMLIRWTSKAGLLGPGWVWVGADDLTALDGENWLGMMDSGKLPSRETFLGFLTVTSRAETTNRTQRVEASAHALFNASITNTFAYGLYDCVVALGMAVAAVLRKNATLTPADLRDARDEALAMQLRDEAFALAFEGASGWVEFKKPGEAGAGDRLPTMSVRQYQGAPGMFKEVAIFRTVGNTPSLTLTGGVLFSTNSDRLEDSGPGCGAGTEFNASLSFELKRDVCQACRPGRYKRDGQPRGLCLHCPAGSYCDGGGGGDGGGSSATGNHHACKAGQFSTGGAAECSPCGRGKYSSSPGSSRCLQCPSGSYQNSSGSTGCEDCPVGTFQPDIESLECESCPETQSTATPGTAHRDKCGCPAGTRWLTDVGLCARCTAGLRCSDFNATPLIDRGYYLAEGEPRDLQHIELFQCHIEEWCPGEVELGDQICQEARQGLNCGMCSPGFYESGWRCHQCTGRETLLYILGTVALVLACGAVQHVWSHQADALEVSEGLLCSLTAGTALAVVQKLGVVGRVGVAWPAGIKAVLSFCSSLFGNLLILTPSCALRPSLVLMYLVRLCTPLVFALICGLWWATAFMLNRYVSQRIPAFSIFHAVNTSGLFLSALYIYAVMATLSLVDCYLNPNQRRTIREFSFALCNGRDFETALPLFIVGVLLYIVGMVGLTLYALWVAPLKYRSRSGFRVMIRFMVYKFRPDKYWFGVSMMLMSLLMSMVTVVFPDSPFTQLLALNTIVVVQLFLHVINMPYSQQFANFVENAEIIGLFVLLHMGIYFQEPLKLEGWEAKASSRAMVIVMFIMCFLLLSSFAMSLYTSVFPHSMASKRHTELERQLDSVLAGCEEIVRDPARFRLLMQEQTSALERQTAAQLMGLFRMALGSPGSPSEKTHNSWRLLTGLRRLSSRTSRTGSQARTLSHSSLPDHNNNNNNNCNSTCNKNCNNSTNNSTNNNNNNNNSDNVVTMTSTSAWEWERQSISCSPTQSHSIGSLLGPSKILTVTV